MLTIAQKPKMITNQNWLIAGLLVSTILAAWPQWRWMVYRSSDGSDDPWGIVALLTIVALLLADCKRLRVPNTSTLSMVMVLMMLATAVWGWLPPIVSTGIAMIASTYLIANIRPRTRTLTPLLSLAVLALPLVASLNFYLGYPLRWFCAQSTGAILSVLGTEVTPEGASLWWNGKTILIDAPCAGIAMLWNGLYLGALFSALNHAKAMRTMLNLSASGVLVVLANVLRNALLFYKESGIVQLPHWTHEAIGILIFALFVPCVYLVCNSPLSFKKRA